MSFLPRRLPEDVLVKIALFLGISVLLVLIIAVYFRFVPKRDEPEFPPAQPSCVRCVPASRADESSQQEIVAHARAHPNVSSVVTRYDQMSCFDLFAFERRADLRHARSFKVSPRLCYGCNQMTTVSHGNYVFSCVSCGSKFLRRRHFSSPQTNKVALVIGGRTKLGHQIALKLLMAGATVVVTSRYPAKVQAMFDEYVTRGLSSGWEPSRLVAYPAALDLDVANLRAALDELRGFIDARWGHLDILVNSAAQTIRCREKQGTGGGEGETNKYGDAKFVAPTSGNSWQMALEDLAQAEMEEVFRVNAVAPTLIVQALLPLLRASVAAPYIINVHAREGLLSLRKSRFHMHTNFGKASLHMLTKCLIAHKFVTVHGAAFRVHGVDPGWISVDEYYEMDRPWLVPPLDEVDGAARVLFPLFCNMLSCWKTRRHFDQLVI